MNIDGNKLVPEVSPSEETLALTEDIRRDVSTDASASELAAYAKGWTAHYRRTTPPPYTREEQRLEFLLIFAEDDAKGPARTTLHAYREDRDARWRRGDIFREEAPAISFHEAIFGKADPT